MRRAVNPPYLSIIITICGVFVYLILSIHFASTQRSIIDEGIYLYKGYLFASGDYYPFQEYGPRTIYAPLSYLIPGYIQLWFGPGLMVGRVFAIIVGLTALGGLWLAARKLGGSWWSAAAVWAVAANPTLIRYYSSGLSQGLVICLLVWIVVLLSTRTSKSWYAILAAALAIIAVMIRQNIAPFIFILFPFIFWHFGRRTGWWATLIGAGLFIGFQIVFWPGILSLWTSWLPASLTPFLNPWRLPSSAQAVVDFPPSDPARFMGFLEGLRFHFLPLTSALLSIIIWPKKNSWEDKSKGRITIFLLLSFGILFVFHTWAGLGFSSANNHNPFTFNPYLSFFSPLGLLLSISIFSEKGKTQSVFQQVFIVILILIVTTLVGYGGFLTTGDALIRLHIPRIKSFFQNGIFLPGFELWDIMASRYGIPYETSRVIVPTVLGLVIGIMTIIIASVLWKMRRKRNPASRFELNVLTVFLATGLILTPSLGLGGGC